jgi:hypothetical protein
MDIVRKSGTWASELVAVGCGGSASDLRSSSSGCASSGGGENVAAGGVSSGGLGGGGCGVVDGTSSTPVCQSTCDTNRASNAPVGQVLTRGKNYEANLRKRNRLKRLKKERAEESGELRAVALARRKVEDELATAKAAYKLEKFKQADAGQLGQVQAAKDRALLAKHAADEVYWKARVSNGSLERQVAVEKKVQEAKLSGSIPLVSTRVRGWAETVRSGSTGSGSKASSGKKTVWSGSGASNTTDLSVYSARIAELEEALRKKKKRNGAVERSDDTSLKAQLDRAKRFIKDKDDHLSRQIASTERAESICSQLLELYRERSNDKDFSAVVQGIRRVKGGLAKTIKV